MNSKKSSPNKMKSWILVALFGALTSAGCFIQIPLPGGVPIVIQDMMAMLSGLLLGPLYGGLAVALFLVLGFIGLPVFSGKAGIQVLLYGPTGGFLIGYLLSAIVGGLILKFALSKDSQDSKVKQWIFISIGAIVATIVVFTCGIPGFMRVTNSGFGKALSVVLVPFIPGNIIKLLVMIPLTKKFRPIIKNYIG